MSDKSESRLPKWVQDELRGLRENVSYWKTLAQSVIEKKSNVGVVDYFAPDNIRYLAKGSKIRFFVGEDKNLDFVDVCLGNYVQDGRALDIAGGCRLFVRPEASNKISIVMDKW